MTPQTLRQLILPLDSGGLHYLKLSEDLADPAKPRKTWYSTQKEHWLGWLEGYSGPGAYDRANWSNRDAKFIYNHIQCAPMLLWLAEALGIDNKLLRQASDDVKAAPRRDASQCAALRKVLPWDMLEAKLHARAKIQSISAIQNPIGGQSQIPNLQIHLKV